VETRGDFMDIVKLNKNHINYIRDIEKIRSFQVQESKLFKFLKNQNNIAYMVIQEGKVVGFAWGYVLERMDNESMLYIHSVDTLEEYRNQGVGTLLIEAFLNYAKEKKLRNTFLITDKGNISANKLYQKFTKNIEEDKILYIFK
jgi:ribosomal protein S18 acetylase RimI-like enzyme